MRIVSFDIGLKNMGVCVLDMCTRKVEWIDVLSVIDAGCKVPAFSQIARKCNAVLEQHLPLLQTCDVVLVEKQVRANPKAVRLAGHVISYASLCLPAASVHEFHARHKTQALGLKANTYRERKKACVDKALLFLADDALNLDALAHFLVCSKRDDMADALCMALAFSCRKRAQKEL